MAQSCATPKSSKWFNRFLFLATFPVQSHFFKKSYFRFVGVVQPLDKLLRYLYVKQKSLFSYLSETKRI